MSQESHNFLEGLFEDVFDSNEESSHEFEKHFLKPELESIENLINCEPQEIINEHLSTDLIFLGQRKLKMQNNRQIEDFIKLLIDDNFFEYLLVQTNTYRLKNFPNMTEIDMWGIKSFLSIRIYMAIVNLQTISFYCSEETSEIRQHFVSNQMSRKRFTEIQNTFHFSSDDDYSNRFLLKCERDQLTIHL